MFPPTRGELGQSAAGPRGQVGDGKFSALVGDVAEVPTARGGAAGPKLSEEELKRKTGVLLEEYLANSDDKEAVLTVQELNAPEFMSQLVYMALEKLLDVLRPRDQQLVVQLVAVLFAGGMLTKEDVSSGFMTFGEALEDLAVDYPMAPKLLGAFMGRLVAEGALSMGLLNDILERLSYCSQRREFAAAVFQACRAKGGDAVVSQKCRESAISAGVLLKHDPEMDGKMDEVEVFLKAEGLAGVVPL